MRRGLSIRLRLTLLYTAILALALIAFGTILYATQARTTYAGIRSDLQRQVALAVGGERRPPPDEGEPPALPGESVDPALPSGTLRGRWLQTRSMTGEVTGQTFDLNGAILPLSAEGLASVQAGTGWYENAQVQDEPLLIYSQAVTRPDGVAQIVQAAYPVSQPQQYLATLRLILLVGSGLALAAACALGWIAAGTALQPIQRITQTAQAIGAERSFGRRVAHRGPPDEVGQLAVTFNDMLAELESGYRQLQDALQSQRRFVADASHELRTPLTTVRGNIELLRREPPLAGQERAEVLADTTEEVDRLIRLVNQLLVLARADAGQPLRADPIAVGPLVEDVCRQARLLAPQTLVECEAADGAVVRGDRDALKQVLLVLMDNALVHTPAGTPVSLKAAATEEQVVFTVRDSGPGIAADALPHIFERFYRGQASRTGGGAGLGLAIARELVEAQGGTLTLESVAGRGTVFTVVLPRG